MKVESGAISGASSCAKKLVRLLKKNLPPSQGGTSPVPSGPPITFGSDLTGDPVAIPGKYPEDTEFWTQGLSIPQDGTVTTFRRADGERCRSRCRSASRSYARSPTAVCRLTTTDPPYQVPAQQPGTYTFKTSDLSFKCCVGKKGDIVTIDNRGADQTDVPYVWFVAQAGIRPRSPTTNPTPGAPTQNPGVDWTPRTHEGTTRSYRSSSSRTELAGEADLGERLREFADHAPSPLYRNVGGRGRRRGSRPRPAGPSRTRAALADAVLRRGAPGGSARRGRAIRRTATRCSRFVESTPTR